MSTSKKRQSALSATEAWERLDKIISQPNEGRKAKTQINDAAELLERRVSGKRKIYQTFLRDVLERCGLTSVVLCAIGLGQAQIAVMNEANRSSLLGILVKNKNNPLPPEIVRTDIPQVVIEDCLMFLEVGYAQDIISELFLPNVPT
ncbi:hypothetical protein B0H63DRAFT_467934 [Podospora didyma]|uniref:Uncharacterized protein n=1 Tax=Podospora didyma TaxID=330526 RepID=A0AAE0NRT5_9PEZI|nr:hypothetical protein B0H63DRAFT_467934 [Podospora didyma]